MQSLDYRVEAGNPCMSSILHEGLADKKLEEYSRALMREGEHYFSRIKSPEEAREKSVIYPLLSSENQKRYEVILNKWRLLPERLYYRTKRFEEDNDSDISQNNLEHIVAGLKTLEFFRQNLPSLESHVDWDRIQWGWLLHDIGEFGQKYDVTTDKKNDLVLTADDHDEIARALDLMCRGIPDGDIHKFSVAPYLGFEGRIVYDEEGQIVGHNLEGCIIRAIDKYEPVLCNRQGGLTQHRLENSGRDVSIRDIQQNTFGKLITPLQIIAQYCDDTDLETLQNMVYEQIRYYQAEETRGEALLTEGVADKIRKEVAEKLVRDPYFQLP